MVERPEKWVAGSLATLRLGRGPSSVNITAARPSSVNSALFEDRRRIPRLLTYEGQMKVVHFLGVQLVFPVCGKRKESVGFMRWKAKGNRWESPVFSRFGSDFSRFQRDSADCGEIAGQSQINSNENSDRFQLVYAQKTLW